MNMECIETADLSKLALIWTCNEILAILVLHEIQSLQLCSFCLFGVFSLLESYLRISLLYIHFISVFKYICICVYI